MVRNSKLTALMLKLTLVMLFVMVSFYSNAFALDCADIDVGIVALQVEIRFDIVHFNIFIAVVQAELSGYVLSANELLLISHIFQSLN